jgi:4-hydroxy-tetrahydrodipicolinate reductase
MRSAPIRVAVVGAAGKMGREALRALGTDAEFEVSAAVVRNLDGIDLGDPVEVLVDINLSEALDRTHPDVVLDLSRAESAVPIAEEALSRGVALVSGVSGLTEAQVAAIREMTAQHGVPAMLVPNFAIGALLAMRFAEMAARWMPDAEIIEMHHPHKADAPSGTAMATASRIALARRGEPTTPESKLVRADGARGASVDGVAVHSVRLPGLLAHQEVLFGAPGEVLTIRHDASDRTVYMAGMKLCLRSVRGLRGLTIGMDGLIG